MIGLLLAALTCAGCTDGASSKDIDGSPVPTPSTSPTSAPSGSPSPSPTPSETDPASAAVAAALDELARTLRDVAQTENSRDAMTATASALSTTRKSLRTLREAAYGTDKSCTVVLDALPTVRSNAARTRTEAATVFSLNKTRNARLSDARSALAQFERLTVASGRVRTAIEKAAVSEAKTTISAAADQVARTQAAAEKAASTAVELRSTAESVAAKAC